MSLFVPVAIIPVTIRDISRLVQVDSPEYLVHNIPWKVKICKQTYNGEQTLAVYLFCTKNDDSLNWSNVATASFKLFSYAGPINTVEHRTDPFVFNRTEFSYGKPDMIGWSDLMNEQNNYVKDDIVHLEIRIDVTNPNDENKSHLSFSMIDKCCDDSATAKFQMHIGTINALTAVRSSAFTLRGLQWDLSVYKSNKGELGFRLQSKYAVPEISCNILLKIILNSTKHGQVPRFIEKSLEYDEILYLDNVISWHQLMDPENGFIVDNYLIIDVEVNAEQPKGVVATARNYRVAACKFRTEMIQLECAICLTSIKQQSVSVTPCGHMFCTMCVNRAVGTRRKCPYCQKLATVDQLQRIYLPM